MPFKPKFLTGFLRRRATPDVVASRRACPSCEGQMRYVALSRGGRLYRRICDNCGYVDPIPVKLRNRQPSIEEN